MLYSFSNTTVEESWLHRMLQLIQSTVKFRIEYFQSWEKMLWSFSNYRFVFPFWSDLLIET